VHRNRTKGPILINVQNAERGVANARGILKYRLEHRFQFAPRQTDNVENPGGGGELFQRLITLAGK